MKTINKMLLGTIMAMGLTACGDDEQQPANPYGPYQQYYDAYAGCVIPPGMKFKSVEGNFNGGTLQLDLYYQNAGMFEAVGVLDIRSLEQLYLLNSGLNQSYKSCVSTQGQPGHISEGDALQELDMALRGSYVFLDTQNASMQLTISGDNLMGSMIIQLQGYPEEQLYFTDR